MALLASDIIYRLGELLNDPVHASHPEPELLAWIGDGQREICNARPDASATVAAVPLAPGIKQSLPSGAIRLLDVTRNLGTNGNTPGAAVRLADLDAQRAWNPNWATATAATAISNYFYDERDPLTWWCDPPVHATTAVYAEIKYTRLVTAPTATTDALGVGDYYANALIDYCLFRACQKDAERRGEAAGYYNSFAQAIGLKTLADRAVSPGRSAGGQANV